MSAAASSSHAYSKDEEVVAKISAAQQRWGSLNPMLLGLNGAPPAEEVSYHQESAADLELLMTSANMGYTSESHPLEPSWIRDAPGVGDLFTASGAKLGLVQCPGRQEPFATFGRSWNRDLRADLRLLTAREETHVLVSLITHSESLTTKVEAMDAIASAPVAAAAGATTAAAVSGGVGMAVGVYHFPMNDYYTPLDPTKILTLAAQILQSLRAKRNVCLHCMDGRSRSGLVAVIVLLLGGSSLSDALAEVRGARSETVSKNQSKWLLDTVMPALTEFRKSDAMKHAKPLVATPFPPHNSSAPADIKTDANAKFAPATNAAAAVSTPVASASTTATATAVSAAGGVPLTSSSPTPVPLPVIT